MSRLLDAPIILLCSERSGSNLIARIFDAHPEVCAPGAAHLFRVLARVAAAPGGADRDGLRRAALALFRAKVSSWQIDTLSDAALAADLGKAGSAAGMAARLYAAEASATGRRHVLIKENSAHDFLPLILAQSRTPRLLFMLRDPRDMALSWINGAVMRGGALRAADRWTSDQRGFLAALAARPTDMPAAFLRYEDLLARPEAELRRVCADLELEFAPQMLRFSETSRSARVDAGRSSMWANLGKPLMTGNAGKFRDHLDADQIAYVEAQAAAYLGIFGYDPVSPVGRPFGNHADLEALRTALQAREPWEKPAYQALPAEERQRFEAWSQVYADLTGDQARNASGPDDPGRMRA
ncbi:sulfotransferase family protein [Pseudooceanicola algae]|uniref:Uncharacterized protein n=1 Tax=Pseudooceanicola algae TaxID=1537215 RepID=A0A418SGG1_9RHOB|nr:sulfotransferase [Pseudooceanicola algae]QPM91678.1 hypothetical protein PSAL_029330 [Pseudooceanicola algae]